MAPGRSTPMRSGGGVATPLSGLRARPVADCGDASELRGSVSGTGAQSLAKAIDALDGLAAEIDRDGVSLVETSGELADDMIAVQKFRCDTVASLADAAADLLKAVSEAQEHAGNGVVSREVHDGRMSDAKRAKDNITAEIIAGEERVETLKARRADTIAQGTELERQEELRRNTLQQRIPVAEKTIAFYEALTHGKFYWRPEDGTDGVLSGFITSPESCEPLTYDYSKVSRFDAVNALWEAI